MKYKPRTKINKESCYNRRSKTAQTSVQMEACNKPREAGRMGGVAIFDIPGGNLISAVALF